jgi:transcriptional regulator with XRE-family HTH domain
MNTITDVGKKIKKIRAQKRLTLRDVATKAGVSATLISDIERGKTSPTIKSLSKISTALDEKIVYFIEDEKNREISLTKKNERATFLNETGDRRLEIISSGISNSKLFMVEVTYLPGGEESKSQTFTGEKCGVVLEGAINVTLDGDRHYLDTCDTIHFDAEIEHSIKNITDKEAKVLWTITPKPPSGILKF